MKSLLSVAIELTLFASLIEGVECPAVSENQGRLNGSRCEHYICLDENVVD